jgi:hypothetical protein
VLVDRGNDETATREQIPPVSRGPVRTVLKGVDAVDDQHEGNDLSATGHHTRPLSGCAYGSNPPVVVLVRPTVQQRGAIDRPGDEINSGSELGTVWVAAAAVHQGSDRVRVRCNGSSEVSCGATETRDNAAALSGEVLVHRTPITQAL